MYNDTVLYREEFAWYHNVSNTYSSQLFENEDGIPYRNISFVKGNPLRYGYLDPYTPRRSHTDLFSKAGPTSGATGGCTTSTSRTRTRLS